MASVYPGAIPSSATYNAIGGHGLVYDDILAIATELGTNPSGPAATVAAAISGKVDTSGIFSGTITQNAAFNSSIGAAQIAGVQLTVGPNTAGRIPLVAQGVVSQTADLQQWRDSAGTVLTRVAPSGDIFVVGGNLRVRSGAAQGIDTTSIAHFNAGGATDRCLTVRGFTSQSADLQQWQNSAGTAEGSFRPGGVFNARFLTASIDGAILGDGSIVQIVTHAATNKGLTIRAAASQTADMTQWTNSANTVLAKITAAGDLDFIAPARGPIVISPDGLLRRRIGITNAGGITLTSA